MNNQKRIYWHQGLFLKPHHFQYLELFNSQDSLALQEQTKPYFWGLTKLSIDEKELLNKNFLLKELDIIFPDGSIVSVPKNAVVANRFFDKKIEENVKDFKVYIGLKKLGADEINVTELDSYENLLNIDTRFITKTDVHEMNNLYQEDETADIPFLDYFLKIVFEDEIEELNGYQVLPIAKINISQEQISLSDDFVPPLLDINRDKILFEMIKKIEKNLTLHSMQLEEYKLPFETIIQEPNYLKYMMALQGLGGLLPKLKHMSSSSVMHPWEYYEVLLQVVGVLSTFSNRVNLFGKMENGNYLISPYEHLNLYKCFEDVSLLIDELLDAIIIGPDYILPFTKENTTFTLDCPVSIFQAKYRYFVSLKTATNKEKIERDFLEYGKLAASSQIETIVQRSLPGLPFDKYDMPIQGMPQNSQVSIFELFTDDVQWTHIQETQNITIEFEDAQDELSIELIILKK